MFADLFKVVGRYLVLVPGGTTLCLVIAPVLGFIPQREGSGLPWWLKPFQISLPDFIDHAGNMIGFGAFVAVYAAVAAAVLYGFARLLRHLSMPRMAVILVHAMVSGFVSGYVYQGLGWMIALDSAVIFISFLLGVVFGVLYLTPITHIRPAPV